MIIELNFEKIRKTAKPRNFSPVNLSETSGDTVDIHKKAANSLSLVFINPIYDHDRDQFPVKTKRLASRMTAQPYNRFVFVSWSWH